MAISPEIYDQAELFVLVFVVAVGVWFLYDLLRLLRRIIPHTAAWMAAEDVLFFFACAMVGFQELYPKSLGQVKGYMLLAFFAGSIVYRLLPGRLLMCCGEVLIRKVKAVFRQNCRKHKEKKKENTEIPIEK